MEMGLKGTAMNSRALSGSAINPRAASECQARGPVAGCHLK